MWNLLKKNDEGCTELRDLFEESAAARREAVRVEELSEDWPLAQREHLAACRSCQEAAQDVLAMGEIFGEVVSEAEQSRPWFATRVMEAIRAQERELALSTSPWSAVPRYASRLAWAAMVVLLAGSAWLYERPVSAPSKTPAVTSSSQEYLFEAPTPPMNQDDVLISMAEKNQ